MRFDEETPTAILGKAVRDLEAQGRAVNENTLFEATRRQGIDREQVRDFLEKAERGKKRGQYPGYSKDS